MKLAQEKEGKRGCREDEGRTYNVPHGSCAEQKDAGVVAPLRVVEVGAIDFGACAVPDAVDVVDETDLYHPVPCPLRGVDVGLVACVLACRRNTCHVSIASTYSGLNLPLTQPRSDVEKAAVRNAVDIVIASIVRKDLPVPPVRHRQITLPSSIRKLTTSIPQAHDTHSSPTSPPAD